MEDLFSFIPQNVQETIFQVLAILTVGLPLLEKLVSLTSTKVDDEALAWVKKALAVVPRVRFGKEVTK